MTYRTSLLGIALALAPFGIAHAVRAADMPPPAPEAVRAANVRPVVAGLRSGVITAVATAGAQIEIDGIGYRCVDGQTQVVRQGRAATAAALVRGQRISFSTAGDGKTLGVVHVQ